jgi:hypothetical protein
MLRTALRLAITSAVLATPLWAQDAPARDTRIPVTTADDLPRHTYKVDVKTSDLLTKDEPFRTLMRQMVADAKSDLEKYRIEDKSALDGYYTVLQAAAMLEGDYDAVRSYIPILRELETNDARRLLVGVTLEALLHAREVARGDETAVGEAFKTELLRRWRELPLETIRPELTRRKGSLRMATPELVLQSTRMQLDPLIENLNGEVPGNVIAAVVTTRMALEYAIPYAPKVIEAIDELLAGTREVKTDIWTPRLVELDASEKLQPVVVAVWDSGVDPQVFSPFMWTNPREKVNGLDDDGNGLVDDLHGIGFDLDHRPTPEPLQSLAELKGDLALLQEFIQGSMDMQAGVQSAEVEKLVAHVRGLSGDAIRDFQEDVSLLGTWAHGTHVAGIVQAGNPFARLLYVRESWEHKTIPDRTPTVESMAAWGASAKQAVRYLKQQNVRVVNMSWRIGRPAIESWLAAKGVGKNAEERAELSRQLFGIYRQALEEAISSAPDILFVAGAGNENNDIDFAEYIPAGLTLPNLVTVGAVDEAGKPTTFTSFGRNVTLYANGSMIESAIPGGRRFKFSGTSMSAPQVANLAAKLLAVDPSLKPAQVIELIREGSEPVVGHDGRLLIHPRKSVELARQRS